MRVEVHLLTHDGEQMIRWSVRHYQQFADKIVIHDGGPNYDASVMMFPATLPPHHRCKGIFVEPWDTAGQLNDELARNLKNSCWRGSDADWVIVVDADELIWGRNVRETLQSRLNASAAILRPRGFEMFSDVWFPPEEHAEGALITDLAPDGSPDDKWYAKPVVFSPRVVAESGFGIGAHESRPVLRDGRTFHCGKEWPFCEDLALLHYKSIFGGLERIAARYDSTRARLSAVNQRCRWGNFKPGAEHAQEKRDLLLSGVRRVVV